MTFENQEETGLKNLIQKLVKKANLKASINTEAHTDEAPRRQYLRRWWRWLFHQKLIENEI